MNRLNIQERAKILGCLDAGPSRTVGQFALVQQPSNPYVAQGASRGKGIPARASRLGRDQLMTEPSPCTPSPASRKNPVSGAGR
jgi:hypothetical protein